MTTNPKCFPASGLDMEDVHKILSENKFQGYPIVEDLTNRTLVGYIGRTELLYAINRLQREGPIAKNAKCYFTPSTISAPPSAINGPAVSFDTMTATAGQRSVDFSRFIDATPLTVHPRLPLETVLELFKKMGPRVILVEHRGKLTGMITVKDCLKYQFKVEAHENPKDDSDLEAGQERVWQALRQIGGWFNRQRRSVGWGALRLGETDHGRITPDTSEDNSSIALPAEGAARQTELELDER